MSTLKTEKKGGPGWLSRFSPALDFSSDLRVVRTRPPLAQRSEGSLLEILSLPLHLLMHMGALSLKINNF